MEVRLENKLVNTMKKHFEVILPNIGHRTKIDSTEEVLPTYTQIRLKKKVQLSLMLTKMDWV